MKKTLGIAGPLIVLTWWAFVAVFSGHAQAQTNESGPCGQEIDVLRKYAQNELGYVLTFMGSSRVKSPLKACKIIMETSDGKIEQFNADHHAIRPEVFSVYGFGTSGPARCVRNGWAKPSDPHIKRCEIWWQESGKPVLTFTPTPQTTDGAADQLPTPAPTAPPIKLSRLYLPLTQKDK